MPELVAIYYVLRVASVTKGQEKSFVTQRPARRTDRNGVRTAKLDLVGDFFKWIEEKVRTYG